MNWCEQQAEEIRRQYDQVDVEWDPANRMFVVGGRYYETPRQAEEAAKALQWHYTHLAED